MVHRFRHAALHEPPPGLEPPVAALVSLHEPAPAVAEPGDGEDGESEHGVASVLSVTEHFNWHPIIEMNKDIYSTVWWVTGEGAGFAMRANSRLVFRWLNNKQGVHGVLCYAQLRDRVGCQSRGPHAAAHVKVTVQQPGN